MHGGQPESYYLALYALISFLLLMLVVMLLYVACSKRYRLNWFEHNLLEAAETAQMSRSQEPLVSVADESQPGSSHSPSDDKFWVPPNLQRQASVDTSGDDSLAGTPCTPTAPPPFSESTTPVALPLARSDKHVVLSTTRPRVSSMHTKLDHTKIDTSLYQKASPSRTPSLPEEQRGSIHMSLTYDPAAGILTVRLIEAHDLQARDFSGTADPYAKIRLLPDRTNVWQTRIHKRTLNPVFDEDFVFEVHPSALGRRTLEVLLYDFDAYSRHHNIGGVKLPLTHIDLSEKVTMWKGLGPCSEQDAKAELGDLMVSLAFLPSAERLTVVVLKARNLRVVDDTRSSSDPFVRVSLMQNGKRVKKKKTGVHRNTVSPVFNEALTFDVGRDVLSRSTLEFAVMHDSLLGPSELLGRALVGSGPGCRPQERDFFAEVLASKTATAQWLSLSEPQ
ncbi:synaptotagmin-5 [Anabrus simplex]|uniref:synaptotagmin-5 n=1 Tax=Anabrus simplex TaxID=316456 RepID=UPI0035A35BDD